MNHPLKEFQFINYLKQLTEKEILDPHVFVGIGDDTAVIDTKQEEYLLLTCDSQIGHVHFFPDKISPFQLGRRLTAVNVSDIGAMGGSPRWALVGLNVPPETETAFLKEFYRGIIYELNRFNAFLVGGNCARTCKDMVFDMFVVGSVRKEHLVTRSGSRDGDYIVITGTLGLARAGFELLRRHNISEKINDLDKSKAIESFLVPDVRVDIGKIIAENQIARAMLDISDGLLQDIFHLCENRDIDAVINTYSIPVDETCRKIAEALGADPTEWALTGGEDYELILSVSPDKMDLLEKISRKLKISYSVIGNFRKGSGRVFLKEGNTEKSVTFDNLIGWKHF